MFGFKRYISSVAWVLVFTGLAKLYSATGTAKVLELPEALLPMSNRQMLLFAGLIEIGVAFYARFGKIDLAKLVCIAWLGGNFMLYRIASILFVVGKPCPCLGSITGKLPLKATTIDRILTGIVFYMVLGSLFYLIALWNRRASRGADGHQYLPIRLEG